MPESAHPAVVLEILTPEERADLARLEETVLANKGRMARAACSIGFALEEISERRLYRATHATWDEYLREKWNITRERARQLRTAAPIMELFGAEGLDLNERQVRDLKLRELEPEELRIVAQLGLALTTGSVPGTSIMGAAVDAVRDLAAGATVQDPATGEPVALADLPPEQRVPALVEAVRSKSRDTQTYQGADFSGISEVRPLDWADAMGDTAEITLTKNPTQGGWRVVVTDRTSGEVLEGPVAKSIWDAIRTWRTKHEAAPERPESTDTPEDEE